MRKSSSGDRVRGTRDTTSRSRGFTLVELLVVIGIIALLISILLPALNKARAQANIAKCSANMRSAVQALHIYTTENKNWLPGPWTSGQNWPGRAPFNSSQMSLTDTSSDETPTQNMDWVSPTFGKTFKWPENDFERLKAIFNLQLACPANDIDFVPKPELPFTSGDLKTNSYAAVLQFHTFPSKELRSGPGINVKMFADMGLQAPASYAPQLGKVGPSSKKVFLVEGSRYIAYSGTGVNTLATETTFNNFRYQIVGGNFMISGPIGNAPQTPYQLTAGANQNFTGKKISPVAATQGWRHNNRMNLAFFDGHVELRSVQESIQVDLYTPKGTVILDKNATFDPSDTNNQVLE